MKRATQSKQYAEIDHAIKTKVSKKQFIYRLGVLSILLKYAASRFYYFAKKVLFL